MPSYHTTFMPWHVFTLMTEIMSPPFIASDFLHFLTSLNIWILWSLNNVLFRIHGTDGSIFHPDLQKNETLFLFNKVLQQSHFLFSTQPLYKRIFVNRFPWNTKKKQSTMASPLIGRPVEVSFLEIQYLYDLNFCKYVQSWFNRRQLNKKWETKITKDVFAFQCAAYNGWPSSNFMFPPSVKNWAFQQPPVPASKCWMNKSISQIPSS